MELVKSLDDLLCNKAYFGTADGKYIATGLGFGAQKGNIIVKYMMEGYFNIHFKKRDGNFDMTTCPIRNTASISAFLASQMPKREIISIMDAKIYPAEYFCPLEPSGVNFRKTEHTYSIHWFSASWLSDEETIIHEWRIFKGKCEKYLERNLGCFVARIIYLFYPKKRRILKKYS